MGRIKSSIKEGIHVFRIKLAYKLAPDLIEDLENRLSAFLYNQTGGRLSKPNYCIRTMISIAADYQMDVCDECWERQKREVQRRKADIQNIYNEHFKDSAHQCIHDYHKYVIRRLKRLEKTF